MTTATYSNCDRRIGNGFCNKPKEHSGDCSVSKGTQLERGKLYQVHYGRGWIIAEFVTLTPAHTAHGLKSTGERTWQEPACTWWKDITGSSFRVWEKDCETRPVTEDTLAEIARLRDEMKKLDQAKHFLWKELKGLCL